MKYVLFIASIFFKAFFVFPQQQKTDSLLSVLEKTKEDTAKIKLYLLLAQNLQFTEGNAKTYSETALSLSQKKGYSYGIANAWYNLARYDYYTSAYKESFEKSKNAFSFFSEINDTNGMAFCLMCIGEAHYSTDHFPEALVYFDSAITFFEKIASETGIANCLMSKGDVFYVQDNFHAALINYKHALEFFEKNRSQLGVANCINCIADVLFDQQDFPQAREKYFQAKGIFTDIGDKLGLGNCTKRLGDIEFKSNNLKTSLDFYYEAYRWYSECSSLNGLGNTTRNLGEVFIKQKDYSSAIGKMNEAIAIFTQTGDGMGLADCFNNMAVINKEQGKIPEAIRFAEKGYSLAKEIGIPEIIQVSAFELGELYSLENQFEKAYFFQKLYTRLNDSINSNENVKKVTRLQMQIDFEQKERERTILQKQREIEHELELEHQKTVRNSFFAGFLIVLLISFFIFKNYRNKQKANLLLAEKNQIIELKNKEITDSLEYAQHIQKAMLTSDEILLGMFPEHFVFFKPRDIISGDFYWANKTAEGKLLWAVADCTGHGVPGALMSMVGNTLLNKIVLDNKIETPSRILNFLSKGVIEILHQKGGEKDSRDGMDMAVCKLWNLDGERWNLEFAGAHNPVWVVKDIKSLTGNQYNATQVPPPSPQIVELKPDNIPVGFFWGDQKVFTNHSMEVSGGDMIYLFSDGFSDQFGGEKRKKFKQIRMKKLILSIHNKSMNDQIEILEKTLDEWRMDLEQVDDICVIGVRVGDGGKPGIS